MDRQSRSPWCERQNKLFHRTVTAVLDRWIGLRLGKEQRVGNQEDAHQSGDDKQQEDPDLALIDASRVWTINRHPEAEMAIVQ